MNQPTNRSFLCAEIIGRVGILGSLDRLMSEVAAGAARTVLIAGEAGIGKTRLATEAQRRALASGWSVLKGGFFETDSATPYSAFIELVQGYVAGHTEEQARESLGAGAVELARLLPELGALLPDLPAPVKREPEQERRRLFEAIVRFAQGLSTSAPLLIAIEDLHWGDEASLELLLHLVRRSSGHRILLLLTYRSDEVNPELGHLLAELDRGRLAEELAPRRLDGREVDSMLRAIFDQAHAVHPEFLDAICNLTEGNPFFIEEVLRSLVAAGDIFRGSEGWDRKPIHDLQIPRTVQDAVRRRSRGLRPETRRLLELAAVAGRRFDFTLLQRLCGDSEQELLGRVHELIDAQLVVEESADRFAFRHALTRESIYSGLLARERQALHRLIAETTEDVYANDLNARLEELSYHYYEAESWQKALTCSLLVAERALRLFAPRPAAVHYTRAIEAARRLSQAVSPELWSGRARAYELMGDYGAALADAEEALRQARALDQPEAEWGALVAVGMIWASRDYAQAGPYYEQALTLARTTGNQTMLARGLNRYGNWLANVGDTEGGIARHYEALKIVEALGDKAAIAETEDLLGMANGLHGNLPEAVEHDDKAVALYRELGDAYSLAGTIGSMRGWPGFAETSLLTVAGVDVCRRDFAEALRLTRQLDWASGHAFVSFCAATTFASFGEFGTALAHASDALRSAEDVGHKQWTAGAYTHLGQVLVSLLQPEAAIEALTTAWPLALELGSAWWLGFTTTYLAMAHVLNGELDQAEATLTSRVTRAHRPRNGSERRMAWAWAELALARGDASEALRIADMLIETAPGGPSTQPIPTLLRLKGDALTALGRSQEALEALQEAQRGANERSAKPLLWLIHTSLGRARAQLGEQAAAEAEFDAARAIITSLASTISEEDMRKAYQDAALATLPRPRVRAARAGGPPEFAGLTAREREVAACVAHGLSNRAIAESLVLSERTVESHVSSILAKLGLDSRAQVAVWAVERGLTRSS